MQLEEKYVTDEKGNRIGVLLDIADYEKLLEELDAIRAYNKAKLSDFDHPEFTKWRIYLRTGGQLYLSSRLNMFSDF